jgi:hypothetical protein
VRTESKDNEESIQRWFDKEVEDGENTYLSIAQYADVPPNVFSSMTFNDNILL